MGEWLALCSACFFAVASIAIRRGSEQMDRDAGHLFSVVVNAVVNGVALAVRLALGPPLAFSQIGLFYFVVAGFFTAFMGRYLWMRSIQLIGPARATSFKTAQVALVFVVAVMVLGERASLSGTLGAVLVLTGLFVLVGDGNGAGSPKQDARVGAMFGIACALAFAMGNLLRKAGMTAWPDATMGIAVGAVTATAFTAAVPGALSRLRAVVRSGTARRGLGLFGVVGVATSASQFCLFVALGTSPVWLVNLLAGTEPMIAAFLSLLFLQGRNPLGPRTWASLGLVTMGIAALALR